MTNNITFQELITQNTNTIYEEKEYKEILNKVTENIAEYTQTHPSTINIINEIKNITINTETHKPILTYRNLEKLTTYLGVDDIIIYTPSRDVLIIDYNNNRPEEEEYYL